MEFELLSQLESSINQLDKHETILVIDDDEATSCFLAKNLNQQGFKTATANSGKKGLTMARSQHPNLIILDVSLPDMDGFAFCESLGGLPETCSIPVIMLSGTDSPGIVRHARAAGAHFFVRKPFDPNALLVLVKQAIRDTMLWAEDESDFGCDLI